MTATNEVRPDCPVAVVVAGAGARGAYEAGVLSTLLPKLEERGVKPSIFVGTSAGAINAALFASLAHLPAADASVAALERWRRIRKPLVLSSVWRSMGRAGVDYVLRILFGARFPLPSLLDTSPMRANLSDETLLDWAQLHDNIITGKVDVLSVVTTEYETNRTKVFFESRSGFISDGETRWSNDTRALDYEQIVLGPDHVLASAAIPVAFPPVKLGTQRSSSWHMDGGVRLNAPLSPAIAFGAKGLVVVATDIARYNVASPAQAGPEPTIQDAIDQVMRGAMSDRMIEDMWTLMQTNALLEHSTSKAPRRDPFGRDCAYRAIPFIFGGPQSHNEIGAIAALALEDCLQLFHNRTNTELRLLSWLLSSSPDTRANLISYLFFEPEFIERAIQAGQRDAQLVLQQKPLWRTTN